MLWFHASLGGIGEQIRSPESDGSGSIVHVRQRDADATLQKIVAHVWTHAACDDCGAVGDRFEHASVVRAVSVRGVLARYAPVACTDDSVALDVEEQEAAGTPEMKTDRAPVI